jgi:H+/Cl- antiporter ClcA
MYGNLFYLIGKMDIVLVRS